MPSVWERLLNLAPSRREVVVSPAPVTVQPGLTLNATVPVSSERFTDAPTNEPVVLDGDASTATVMSTVAVGRAPEVPELRDVALQNGFAMGEHLPLGQGATGPAVVAVQYALGRLGFVSTMADGIYGRGTATAVRQFQEAKHLPATGIIDVKTLRALDAALVAYDPRTPAAKAADPIAYLRDFTALGFSRLTLTNRTPSWSNPEVQQKYGEFVAQYWPVMKANQVEGDCKTIALFMMDSFRTKVKADTGVQLPLPRNGNAVVPARDWLAATAAQPQGFFTRTDALPTVRGGYGVEQAVERLDPRATLLMGVNLRYAGVAASTVVRATTPVASQLPIDNLGDDRFAEVDVQQLKPGELICIDHTGDGTFDHAMTVVGVERRANGTVSRLTLALGSYDDMKDSDAATVPNSLAEVNNYAEEVVIDFTAEGRIGRSAVTWSSEPSYLVKSRYSHRSTVMELRPGGVMRVARWG